MEKFLLAIAVGACFGIALHAGESVTPAKSIGLEEVKKLSAERGAILVDSRNAKAFKRGHIPGAMNLPLVQFNAIFPKLWETLDRDDRPVVVYCEKAGCDDGTLLAKRLAESGVRSERILVYKGGWLEWAKNRGAVESGDAEG